MNQELVENKIYSAMVDEAKELFSKDSISEIDLVGFDLPSLSSLANTVVGGAVA